MDKLGSFIQDSRKKGYSDLQIHNALLKNGWSIKMIEEAFHSLEPKSKLRNQVCIFLSSELISKLEKRAKKNLFTLSEQIEDILRRSCIGIKKSQKEEKLDDILIKLFSRKR